MKYNLLLFFAATGLWAFDDGGKSINSNLISAIVQEEHLEHLRSEHYVYDHEKEKNSEQSLRLSIVGALRYSVKNKGMPHDMRFLVERARLKLAKKAPLKEAIILYQTAYREHRRCPFEGADAIFLNQDFANVKELLIGALRTEMPPQAQTVLLSQAVRRELPARPLSNRTL